MTHTTAAPGRKSFARNSRVSRASWNRRSASIRRATRARAQRSPEFLPRNRRVNARWAPEIFAPILRHTVCTCSRFPGAHFGGAAGSDSGGSTHRHRVRHVESLFPTGRASRRRPPSVFDCRRSFFRETCPRPEARRPGELSAAGTRAILRAITFGRIR